jgi:hypothetical protein
MSDSDSINEQPLMLTPKQKWRNGTIELLTAAEDID